MATLVVGNITFDKLPVGAVIARPKGELAFLWAAYANAIERERVLRKKLAEAERKQ